MKDYNKNNIILKHGDSAKRLKELEDNSIDSIVTDPPYFVAFMGKKWDRVKDRQDAITKFLPIFQECFRVLKPGGHLLAFALPRTSHYTACLLEDAGFELRDSIHWLFGSGFPKSHNIGLSIDKHKGHPNRGHRIATASRHHPDGTFEPNGEKLPAYEGKTEEGKEWKGWGTALKPAHELIWLARKPLEEDTVAEQVLATGTGGLNIDACRVGYTDAYDKKHQEDIRKGTGTFFGGKGESKSPQISMTGRFPANLILGCSCENPPENSLEVKDYKNKEGLGTTKEGWGMKRRTERIDYKETTGNHEPDCICAELDAQSGNRPSGTFPKKRGKTAFFGLSEADNRSEKVGKVDNIEAGASRFFYCAKVSTAERNAGLEKEEAVSIKGRDKGQDIRNVPHKKRPAKQQNTHPTVKPLKLMSYLITLITPPNGTVLDPFAGSGSTGVAAKELGFKFIGIEREKEYFKIAKKRISKK